jgi:two-component system, response regulator FlrC
MMAETSVIIVHGSPQVTEPICRSLSQAGYPTQSYTDVARVQAQIHTNACLLLIADEKSLWRNGRSIYDSLETQSLPVPIILLAEKASVQRAVESIKMGASDYLAAPVVDELLLASVAKVLSKPNGQGLDKNISDTKQRSLITCAKSMQQLLSVAQRVAGSSATVLIQGESGTGKELLARHIHYNSPRKNRPFVAINCAALPENLAESELFGYEKGAFTGAAKARPGKFEQAHSGTLLLDEISEMPLSLQAKLLRVLQEKEVDHLGGQKPIGVDVRCIVTSNQDLAQMVKERRFRQDLYYRLRVIPLTIPPLRERKEDIPYLVAHFVRRFTPAGCSDMPQFEDSAMAQMLNWNWSGNVRELENTVERALLLSEGPTIGIASLLLDQDIDAGAKESHDTLVGMTVKELEKRLIGQTLTHLNHNRTHAAQMLGISIRTLRNKLLEYRGSIENPPSPDPHGNFDPIQ